MGVVFAFLATFSYSVANLFGKKAAAASDLVPGFVAQYGLVTVFSVFFGLLSGQAFFSFSPELALCAAILGISGYAGIFALLTSSRYMSMSISLSLAYGYVVVLYFVNARLFEAETLSISKLAVALAFFASIAAFLVSEGRKGSPLFRHLWLPVVSLVSWTFYFGVANYVVKTGLVTPIWSLFLAEGSIFLTALSTFLVRSGVRISRDGFSVEIFGLGELSAFSNGVSMAVFLALWTGFLLVSYASVAANLSNTIGLFTTILTAVLSAWIFHEKLRKSEWALISVSTLLLWLFLIVP